MLAAGVPITRALSTVHKRGKFGRIFTDIEREVAQGYSLADAVQQRQRHFRKLDITLIRAGEETGQLAEMLAELGRWYTFRQRTNRMVLAGLVYPIMMIHALAFIAPVVPMALGGFDPAIYIRGALTILGLFYIPALMIAAVKILAPKRGPLRSVLDMFIMKVPLVGRAVRDLELSRFARVFSVTYRAGVPIVRSAEISTEVISNQAVAALFAGAAEMARAGQELSAGFSKRLPLEFINLWEVGEESGQLDDTSARLANMYSVTAEMKFGLIAEWAPRIVYAVVAAVMVYFIFTGFLKIYGGIL